MPTDEFRKSLKWSQSAALHKGCFRPNQELWWLLQVCVAVWEFGPIWKSKLTSLYSLTIEWCWVAFLLKLTLLQLFTWASLFFFLLRTCYRQHCCSLIKLPTLKWTEKLGFFTATPDFVWMRPKSQLRWSGYLEDASKTSLYPTWRR